MKKRIKYSLALLMAIVLIFGMMPATVFAATDYSVSVTGTFGYEVAYKIAELVNAERVSKTAEDGIARPMLTVDADLMKASMQRAAEISIYYSHTRPDATSCLTVSPKAYGENIAYNSITYADAERSANTLYTLWKNSPPHYASMINPDWSSIGVGVFWQNAEARLCGVQLFGFADIVTEAPQSTHVSTVSVNIDEELDENLTLKLQLPGNSLDVNQTKQLILQCGEGAISNNATWKSSDTTKVTVDSNGKVTGISEGGPVTVTATLANGKTVTKMITVNPYVPPTDMQVWKHIPNSSYYTTFSGDQLMDVDETIEMMVTLIPDNVSDKELIISLKKLTGDEESISFDYTPSTDWQFFDVNAIAEGTTQLIITSKADPSITETVTYVVSHDWGEWNITTLATCEADGEKQRVCKNNPAHTETDTIPAIGHKWDSGVVTIPPTADADGLMTYTCLNDNAHTYTEVIPSVDVDIAIDPAAGLTMDGGKAVVVLRGEWAGEKTFTDMLSSVKINGGDIPVNNQTVSLSLGSASAYDFPASVTPIELDNATFGKVNVLQSGIVEVKVTSTADNDKSVTFVFIVPGDINRDGRILPDDASCTIEVFGGDRNIEDMGTYARELADLARDGEILPDDVSISFELFGMDKSI